MIAPADLDRALAGGRDERDERIAKAARSVAGLCHPDAHGRPWRPKGIDEIAVLLESLGYSPEVVAELWFADIFALAREVQPRLADYADPIPEPPAPHGLRLAAELGREFAAGLLGGSQSVIALVGLWVFGAALWSTGGVSPATAAAMLLGLYGAYTVTGCCAGAFSARLGYYLAQEAADVAAGVARVFAVATTALVAAVALTGWFAIAAWQGAAAADVAVVFFVAVALYGLWLTPLLVERRFGRAAAVAVALAVTGGLTARLAFAGERDRAAVALAVEAGVTGVMLAAGSLVALSRRARAVAAGATQFPGLRSLAAGAAPYAAFGGAYALAILVDHLCAGLGGGGFRPRAGYELACNLAMLELIPLAGIVNVANALVARRLRAAAAAATLANDAAFGRRAARELAIVGALCLVTTGAIVALAQCAIAGWIAHARIAAIGIDTGDLVLCARTAAFAYAPAAIVLTGSHLLFTLRRHWIAVAAMASGALVNLCAGIVVERLALSPALSITGVATGLTCAALIVVVAIVATLRRLDYWYYAAY